MDKLIKTILVILMLLSTLSITKTNNVVEAETASPEGNYISLNIKWEEGCKELVDYSGSYTLAGNKYEVKNYKTGEIVGYFVIDKNGKGINEKTGTSYIDNLPDGTYRITMESANNQTKYNDESKLVELKASVYLPTTIEVNTLADVFGRNSAGKTTGWSSAYKFWSVAYGTGVFECAICEKDPPSSIRSYGKHTISTNGSYVLDRNGTTPAGYSNELIYKIMYYTSDEAMWTGFNNVKNIPWTTRDMNNYTYYSTGQTDAQKVAEFVRHVALSRAWGRDNGKWNVQQYQDGFSGFWLYVTNQNTPNAPEDYRVLVWEGYQQGVQDMMYAYKLQVTDYDKANVDFEVKTEFDPILAILTKSGTDSERIADAEFTMKYYREDFSKATDASKYSAVKTWIFKTDADGVLQYKDAHKVSGDEIIKDENGNAVLIPGTYTVEETKVPTGYTKADTFLIKASADLNVMPTYLDKNGNPIPRTLEAGYSLTELKEGYATLNKKPATATSNSVAGAEYTVYVDEACTTVAKINNTNDDAILVTKADGTTQTIALAPATYYVKETKVPSKAFKLDPTVHKVNVEEETTVTVESTEELSELKIAVIKKDSVGEPVKDVVFGVYDANDAEIAEITTDENGKGSVTVVYEEGLYLKEKSCPYGYKLNENKFPVTGATLNNDGVYEIEPIEVTDDLENIKVKVIKVDADNNEVKLDGAAFEIRDTDGNVISKGVTENGGTCTFSIQFRPEYNGKLVLVETVAPFGYKLGDVTEYEIDFSEGNREFTFVNEIVMTIENEAYHFDLEVIKVDAETDERLSGATFAIFDADTDEKVMEAVSGEDGIARFEDVTYGHYYVKETEAPYGYQLLDEKYDVVFDENYDFETLPITITVKDPAKRYSIAIHKTAKDGSKRPLEGCEFTLFSKDNDEAVATVTTDEEGIAKFEDIPYRVAGYYAKETATIDGYKLSEEVIDCQVDESFWDFSVETLDTNFENEAYNIRVHVIKTDGENEVKIENTTFSLYYKYNDEIATDLNGNLCTGLTDENGELTFDVPYDEYYIKEDSAAFGYIRDESVYEVTFDDDYRFVNEINEAENIEVTNTSYHFTVNVNKMDSKTKEALEGAEFTLYRCVDDEVVATAVSNADGICIFKDVNYCTGGFYLVETKAPEGYVKSDKRFVIDEDSLTKDKEFDFNNRPEITYDIPNKLIQLPNTGDSVQLLFGYSTMTLSACGLLCAIRAKKKHTEEEKRISHD